MASFCARVFADMCKPADRPIRDRQVVAWFLAEQCGRCASCGADITADEYHMGHKIARASFGSDGVENLQLLCASGCHAAKTALDTQSMVEDAMPLLSRFSLETHKAFVQAQKPPQLVADLHVPRAGDCLNVDVIRCRYSSFVEANEHDLPIFAPTDEILPAREGELGDFTWVSVGAVKSMRRALPYWGPGWYGRATCEFFLDAGIARWTDFKLSFSASAHRPPAYLRARLKVFDYLWRQTARSEAARELVQGDKADLAEFYAKLCCNMLFGTWAVRERLGCGSLGEN